MSDFPKNWVELLFRRFSVMYGSKWTAMWADVPMADVLDAWQTDLDGVKPEQIKRALEHMKSHNPFPPTLPEFLGICRQFRPQPSNVRYLAAPKTEMPANVKALLAKLRGR
jgi:hypothetical protein